MKSKTGDIFLFIAMVLSLVVIGPMASALLYPFLSGSWIGEYVFLFLPHVITFIVLLVLKGKDLKEELRGKDGESFSLPLFFLLTFVSFVYCVFLAIFKKPEVNDISLSVKLISLLLSLILIPMQIGVEEMIFRTLPIRIYNRGQWKDDRFSVAFISLISALLFTLPHLFNKEVWVSSGGWAILHYALWGALAAAATIVTGGYEIAYATHLANNLFVSIAVNYKGSSLPSASFFLSEEETSSPTSILSFVFLFALLTLSVVLWKRRKRDER